MLRFARISKLAIRHIASCNAVRQGDTLRLAHLHMSCFSPVPAHHPVLLSMAFPIHAASHPLVSTSLNSSAYSYAFHASCFRNALLLFLSSNLFRCAAVFPIFALFCQALDLPFIFLFARPVANGAVYPTPAFFSQHIFISYTHFYPSEQRLPSASPLSKHSERKVVAFPHLLSFVLHAAAPQSCPGLFFPCPSRKVFRHTPYLPSQASASEVFVASLPHFPTPLMALGLLVCYQAGLFGIIVSAPCRFWLCEDEVAGREATVCRLDGGGRWKAKCARRSW